MISYSDSVTLCVMQNLPKLSELNVSWNGLTCYFSDVSVLRRHTPGLVSLDCRHNPWAQVCACVCVFVCVCVCVCVHACACVLSSLPSSLARTVQETHTKSTEVPAVSR